MFVGLIDLSQNSASWLWVLDAKWSDLLEKFSPIPPCWRLRNWL